VVMEIVSLASVSVSAVRVVPSAAVIVAVKPLAGERSAAAKFPETVCGILKLNCLTEPEEINVASELPVATETVIVFPLQVVKSTSVKIIVFSLKEVENSEVAAVVIAVSHAAVALDPWAN